MSENNNESDVSFQLNMDDNDYTDEEEHFYNDESLYQDNNNHINETSQLQNNSTSISDIEILPIPEKIIRKSKMGIDISYRNNQMTKIEIMAREKEKKRLEDEALNMGKKEKVSYFIIHDTSFF